MNLPENSTKLFLDSPTFVDDFAAAIDLNEGDTLEITTPQFDRIDNVVVPEYDPKIDFSNLHLESDDTLLALGCGIWDKDDRGTTWLFPKEWYPFVPEGLSIVDINGNVNIFNPSITDNDYRFGYLSFGLHKTKK